MPGNARRRPNANAQAVAAGHLAAGSTIAAAADAAGVNEKTVRRWIKEQPEFQAAVEELRSEVVSLAVARLSSSMADAAEVLGRLLRSQDPRIRLRASKIILDSALKVREREELEERLRSLEAKLAGAGP